MTINDQLQPDLPSYTLDLERWIQEFPLRNGCLSDELCNVVSPSDLAYLEQLRARVLTGRSAGRTIAVDIFVFGLGEPSRRDVTKVGGLPYRPAGEPWPVSTSGRSMTFLAQFRFTESRDILPDLPADILLIFAADEGIAPNVQEDLVFEWYPLGVDNLVQPDGIPEPLWTFVKCYGVRHRTIDYADCDQYNISWQTADLSSLGISPSEVTMYNLAVLEGMKIGGIPYQSPDEPVLVEELLSGRYLASLSTIFPVFGSAYPWINAPEPLPDDSLYRPDLRLYFADGFNLYFAIDDVGSMHWHMEVR